MSERTPKSVKCEINDDAVFLSVKNSGKMFCRNQLLFVKENVFPAVLVIFIKSEILKSDDLKNLSECCLSLKTGGMDGEKEKR